MTKEYATDLIEEVIEQMCDHYCKHRDNCSQEELDEICEECVLANLREIEGEEVR